MRRFGKAAFAALQDGESRLQVYLKRDLLGDQSYRLCQELDLGDWIGVDGRLFRTKTDELTVEVQAMTFLSKGLRPLPEKWHGLTDIETRYRQRYVDLIANPSVHHIFHLRSQIIAHIRTFFISHGFLEVENTDDATHSRRCHSPSFCDPSQHTGYRIVPSNCSGTVPQTTDCRWLSASL